MKRILLISLLICNASLLDAMANPEVVIDANATIEHRANGTFVHYLRDGQEMVVFNADLLNKSGTIADMFEDIGSSDQNLAAIVRQLFDGLAGIEQIKLTIQALDVDNPPLEEGGVEIAAKEFVDQIETKDLAWLSNWTDEWQINFVYDALVNKIASKREVAFNLYNSELLNNTVAQAISDIFDVKQVAAFLLERLVREIVPQLWSNNPVKSIIYSPNGARILVGTRRNVMAYDSQGNLVTTITPQLQEDEDIGSVFYDQNGVQILVETNERVLMYDLQGNLIIAINPKLQWGEVIMSVLQGESQILIRVDDRVMLYDLQGNLTKTIAPLQQGEAIWTVFYSPDKSQILVGTKNNKVIIYDLNGNLMVTIVPQLLKHEFHRTVLYSPDGQSLLVLTDAGRMMIYDLKGNLITTIIPQLQPGETIWSAVYNPNGSQILARADRRVMIYELQGRLVKSIAPLQQNEMMKSAIYGQNETQILITTTKKVMIYDFQSDSVRTITPQLSQGELVQSALYSPDGLYVLVRTNQRVLICSGMNFAQLNLAQKILLLKAYEAWKANKPYIVDQNEFKTYDSLPDELKDEKLFVMPSINCMKMERA